MIYHNEIDAFPAQWLRNLADAGAIDGPVHVDERSIVDVQPDDLADATQAHFFSGIGGWSHALRLVGWPATRIVWTGSCPCQPFSSAGRGKGTADKRHLWPEFRRLITECLPPVIFGEQVASKLGREWLAGVRTDLEALGYIVGAADLCAAGVGAPHIRQRLYWGAVRLGDACSTTGGIDAGGVFETQAKISGERLKDGCHVDRPRAASRCMGGLADADSRERDRVANGQGRVDNGAQARWIQGDRFAEPSGAGCRLVNTDSTGRSAGCDAAAPAGYGCATRAESWAGVWHHCLDGKSRRIPAEPKFFPLAHGLPGRVGQLRAYGNAIVPQVAAEFVTAFMEAVEAA